MAIGKRHTRRIQVDGQDFRWRCDFHEPADKFSKGFVEQGQTWKPDTLIIRPEDNPNRLLTVTWPACLAPVVTPHFVRLCIMEALQQGWLKELVSITLAGADIFVKE